MVAAVERLKRRADFLLVADTRRRHATPGLVLQARRRETSGATEAMVRVGFTATRKIGNAVIRNRARRRLRAVAAEILPIAAAPGFDYVLIARAGTLTRPYDKLQADLRAALAAVAPRGAA